MNKKSQKSNLRVGVFVFSLFVGVFFLGQVAFLVFGFLANSRLSSNILAAQEASRPAEIGVIVLTDQSCAGCVDVTAIVSSLKKEAVAVTSEQSIDVQSDEGRALITKYDIKKVPTVLLRGELEKNSELAALLPKIGSIAEDGTFILNDTGLPYRDVSNNTIVGTLSITMFEDRLCETCYNVTVHKNILGAYGYRGTDYTVVDIDSDQGRQLLSSYKISLIPTIIIQGDMGAYPEIQKMWDSLGTVERDGTYVMRDQVALMGVYKDLFKNKIINPNEAK